MANVEFSGLPAASTITGSEIVPVMQAGVTAQTTVNAISQLGISGAINALPPASTLTGTEVLPLLQPSAGVKTTMAAIAAFANAGGIPTNLTMAQLNTQYTAVNVSGTPTVSTSDGGLATFNGSSWQSLPAYVLQQVAIKQILPPSLIMGNNGAYTLGTPLDGTYSGYLWCWPGMIFSGSNSGWFWTVMSSTTQGIVYNNKYQLSQPVIPATPTPFVSTGPGAFTCLINTLVTGLNCNPPAYGTGLHGRLETKFNWTTSNTAGNKTIVVSYGGSNLFSDVETNTSTSGYTTTRTIINQGQLGAQFYTGVNGNGVALGQGSLTVDSTKGQWLGLYHFNGVATDWQVLHYLTTTLSPSGALDAPAAQAYPPAGPTIIPAGAAAIGATTNAWFAQPTSADVSLVTNTTSKLFAGAGEAAGNFTNATYGNGATVLSINQLGNGINTACGTQNNSGVQGALASASALWFYEVAFTLTSNTTDHWPAVYSNPNERNGGSTVPYVEVDGHESGIGSKSATDPYNGSQHSVINWPTGSGGSPSTVNNTQSSSFYGVTIDPTKEMIIGYGYNGATKQITFWVNGTQAPFTVSTAAYDANINTLHYFLVLQAASRTSGAGGAPYSMLVRYMALWT